MTYIEAKKREMLALAKVDSIATFVAETGKEHPDLEAANRELREAIAEVPEPTLQELEDWEEWEKENGYYDVCEGDWLK